MPKNITIVLVVVSLMYSCESKQTKNVAPSLISVQNSIVPIKRDTNSIKVWQEINFNETQMIEKMAYADTANFMHEKIYSCAKCFLRTEAADALLKANQLALKEKLRLVLFDCYRPKVYQQKMYDIAKNPNYVALPTKGSMHNKGLAVDIGLADIKGNLLDCGSRFDDFSEKAHFSYSNIPEKAKSNRRKLREIMMQAGFEPYKNEWWHFNYSKAEYPTDDFIWNCN
jgi:D-alanyl-D-alanine dipeptidase